jgi:SulP family sulfate permease
LEAKSVTGTKPEKIFKFDRFEWAGSLSDLGTLLPLMIPLIIINGLNPSSVMILLGGFYVAAGGYFQIPLPVQPLKAVAVIAITSQLSSDMIAAAGLLTGILLLIIASTGLIDSIARLFSRPVVRGIQLGLGFMLMRRGIEFILNTDLLIDGSRITLPLGTTSIPLNPALGIVCFLLVFILLGNKRFPASLAILFIGIVVSIASGGLAPLDRFAPGFQSPHFFVPKLETVVSAFLLLVVPQIPLTIGNAVIATSDCAQRLYRQRAGRTTPKALAVSMGVANVCAGTVGAMPMCHGAGGLAASYRFGARSGGSDMIIGGIFLILGLCFGKAAIPLLSLIPISVLGVLLLFAGIELCLLITDLGAKREWVVVVIVAGVALTTSHMTIAFGVGIVMSGIMKVVGMRME